MIKSFLPIFCLALMSVALFHADAQGGAVVCPPGSTAPECVISTNSNLTNPFKDSIGDTLPQLFRNIIEKILLPVGSVIAVLAFIWSGFLFVTAQGDEKKIATARTALLYTAIGTAILLGATAIIDVLSGTIDSLKGP